MPPSSYWLVLAIGNSRLHWALFDQTELQQTWDTAYLSERAIAHLSRYGFSPSATVPLAEFPAELANRQPPLWLASVVPQQSRFWEQYPQQYRLRLNHIPLQGLYPTLGIDRALTLWGAVQTHQAPVLVVDAGTALTFTAADAHQQLMGGGILPGLSLQIQSLVQGTAALPLAAILDGQPVPRWATRTPDAIRSGVIHGILATIRDFVADWWLQYPQGAIALTGGDSTRIYHCLQAKTPAIAGRIALDPDLLFRGMSSIAIAEGQPFDYFTDLQNRQRLLDDDAEEP